MILNRGHLETVVKTYVEHSTASVRTKGSISELPKILRR